jgi:hypothetical protein
MPRYLLTIQQPDGPAPPPETLNRIMGEVNALTDELRKSGALVLNGGLRPPAEASVVRPGANGGQAVTDGPYTEAKEHIGGLIVVDAAGREEALEVARRAAKAITLPIELREFIG